MRYTTRIIVPPRVRRSGMPGSPGGGPRPQSIGVRKSFGFSDPTRLAAAGQVAAASEHPDFAPFFAQHSRAAVDAAGRTPLDTLLAAARAVGNARYRSPWGADADGLRTPQEVEEATAAGFTYFTVDLSAHVRDDVDELSPDALAATVAEMVAGGDLPDDWASPYLDRAVDLPGIEHLALDLCLLQKAAVRFGRAIQHGARMYEAVARANRGQPYEIEISLDGVAAPIGTAEHLFIGLELESRGVRLTGLALRLDDREPVSFEAALREHVAVAAFCGPYKLSFRSGTHDPALVPVIGRCCGDLLHYKTSSESFAEALRLAWRLDPYVYGQIIPAGGALDAHTGDHEELHLEGRAGEALTASILPTFGQSQNGSSPKAALLELVEQRADVYKELLVIRYGRLIESLNAG